MLTACRAGRGQGAWPSSKLSVVKRIKPENLVEYEEAPEGKRLHKGCPR